MDDKATAAEAKLREMLAVCAKHNTGEPWASNVRTLLEGMGQTEERFRETRSRLSHALSQIGMCGRSDGSIERGDVVFTRGYQVGARETEARHGKARARAAGELRDLAKMYGEKAEACVNSASADYWMGKMEAAESAADVIDALGLRPGDQPGDLGGR